MRILAKQDELPAYEILENNPSFDNVVRFPVSTIINPLFLRALDRLRRLK
jgi:hypothetical protein